MNTFEEVKSNITARQAAERYGIKVNRHGMALCPFHNDKHPSMKVDKRYHCFACQADGDVIDLVANLYGLPPKEAVIKLAGDFGIPITIGATSPHGQAQRYAKATPRMAEPPEQVILKAALPFFHSLASYYHMLQYWQEHLTPKIQDTDWDHRFVEALQKKSYVEYLLDTLLWGTDTEKIALLTEHGKEVNEYAKRITEHRKNDPGRSPKLFRLYRERDCEEHSPKLCHSPAE